MGTDDSSIEAQPPAVPPPPGTPPVGGPGSWQPSGAPRDAILPSQPPKEPVAALLLNIFFASVGYFIIGQWQKGIAATVAFIVELILAFGIGLVSGGCGTCIVIPLSLAFHAVLSVDVYLHAKVLQAGRPIGQWTFFNQPL